METGAVIHPINHAPQTWLNSFWKEGRSTEVLGPLSAVNGKEPVRAKTAARPPARLMPYLAVRPFSGSFSPFPYFLLKTSKGSWGEITEALTMSRGTVLQLIVWQETIPSATRGPCSGFSRGTRTSVRSVGWSFKTGASKSLPGHPGEARCQGWLHPAPGLSPQFSDSLSSALLCISASYSGW